MFDNLYTLLIAPLNTDFGVDDTAPSITPPTSNIATAAIVTIGPTPSVDSFATMFANAFGVVPAAAVFIGGVGVGTVLATGVCTGCGAGAGCATGSTGAACTGCGAGASGATGTGCTGVGCTAGSTGVAAFV